MIDDNVTPIHGRVPKPADGEPLITMFMDDDRVIFRDKTALDEYVAEAKAEDRERIAQAIEHGLSDLCRCTRCETVREAARIAREGGASDD